MANKRGKLSKDECEIIHKMYMSDKTIKQIANFLNRSENIVLKEINNTILSNTNQQDSKNAKNNKFVDDLTLDLQRGNIKLLQTEEEKQRFIPQERRRAPKKIKAVCRHCGNEGVEFPHLIFNGEYSCNRCLRGLS